MANTVIQLKYSNITSAPPLLDVSEPAYSNVSNKLWINDGAAIVPIGGYYYTAIIDAATASKTANQLVLRDSNANFSANIVTANLNGYLVNARNISLAGDANGTVSFNASQDVTLTVDLTASGATPGIYGGTTKIPTLTVDLDGRISSIANVDVATTLSFTGDTGSGTLDLLTNGLKIEGGDGITSVAYDANNTVTVHVDNTVMRTSGGQTIGGDLAVSGNLVISGTTVTQDVTTVQTEDSLIKLAANNAADVLDIGFYGQYTNGGTKYAGLVRDATDGVFKLFVGETTDPTDNVLTYGTENRATLDANFTGGNVSSLYSAISVTDGGTGFRTANVGDIIVATGVNTFGKLLKPAAGNAYLRMSSAGNASWVDTVAVEDGGTGNTTFTVNHVLLGNGTNPVTTVGSSTEGHILTINASGAPQFVHLNGGSF